MKGRLLSAAALCAVLSGGALANHQAPNLKAFRTVCVFGVYEEQGKENKAVLDNLFGRITGALDRAGIEVGDGCKPGDVVAGKPLLNLTYTFTTTRSARPTVRFWTPGCTPTAPTPT